MMKKTLILFFFTGLWLSVCGQGDWTGRTKELLDSLCADTLFRTTQIGLAVWDLTDDSLLYEVGYRQRLRPASCQKVLTAVTALRTLGVDYRYVPYVREAGWGWCWDDKISTPKRPGAPLLNENKVQTLGEVLQPMLKQSDNLMAESVFLQLAAYNGKNNAGHKEAAKEVEKLITDLALNPEDYIIADGSGLSLYNYVTPELLVQVLRYAWQWDNIRIPFIEALPIAGMDGTLEKRMQHTTAHGNVRAKTGTVEGISSLAGYCKTSEGHFLCYAIINQGVIRARHGRDFQDAVCITLTR